MKVKELIEQLQKCDAESDVFVLFDRDNPLEDEGFPVLRVLTINFPSSGEVCTFINSEG